MVLQGINIPVGHFKASWSNVRHFPPAAKILCLAFSVNLKAQTVSLGTWRSLTSLVTVQTQTAIWFSLPFMCLAILEMLIG